MEVSNHFAVGYRCGICNWPLSDAEEDPVYLLVGNSDSTGFVKHLGPFYYPPLNYHRNLNGSVYLCRTPDCSDCTESSEAVAVHNDCFGSIPKLTTVYTIDHLWITISWRSPWRQAPYFQLEDMTPKPDFAALDKLGIPLIRRLPPEIVHIIYKYSQTSDFWRYCDMFSLGRSLVPLSKPPFSVPLGDISTWTRGGQVERITDQGLPIIRLTIDSWGLKKIESLSSYPKFKNWRTDHLRYVVTDRSKVNGILAHCLGGIMRLQFPKMPYPGFQTWDTPTPPNMEECALFAWYMTEQTQFRVIDLDQVFGLTFFCHEGNLYDIHVHTKMSPCAKPTYHKLSGRRQLNVVWVYVPISKTDSITVMGQRVLKRENSIPSRICVLLRLRLAGDIFVALSAADYNGDLRFSQTNPQNFIYSVPDSRALSVFGVFTPEPELVASVKAFHYPIRDDPPIDRAYFAAAPLSHIDDLKVFHDAETGSCVGILLRYNNGAERCVGQCRLGVDNVQYFERPNRICLRKIESDFDTDDPDEFDTVPPTQNALVSAACNADHDHAEPGWACLPMRGELQCWFSCEETDVRVMVD
ncbi:hypothetical protein VHEMI10655 [[Torrubiella] hemipterigena]|uniref:Uncharacterized protein n=1 Tax=[Torrubiella] hemipterigena TaxID=1531966 RepID=A0A0A1TTL9_9HYPO|nr:hypothetical protein VHEMI10655 [[Torrubiella] hemipterigena]